MNGIEKPTDLATATSIRFLLNHTETKVIVCKDSRRIITTCFRFPLVNRRKVIRLNGTERFHFILFHFLLTHVFR